MVSASFVVNPINILANSRAAASDAGIPMMTPIFKVYSSLNATIDLRGTTRRQITRESSDATNSNVANVIVNASLGFDSLNDSAVFVINNDATTPI